MGGVVSAIFGGGDKPDNSAQLAAIEASNREQRDKLDASQAKLDAEERKKQEQLTATAKARRGGGTRALLSQQRLSPEVGLPGQDTSQTTLGPKA